MGNEPLSAKMMDLQATPPMWPESLLGMVRLDGLGQEFDAQLSNVTDRELFSKEHVFADSGHFLELLDQSLSGSSQQASLAKLYEERQLHAVNLLRQQLDTLSMQRLEAEQRQLQILDENVYDPFYNKDLWVMSEGSPSHFEGYLGDDGPGSWSSVPGSEGCSSELEGDYSVDYWRDRARGYAKLLSESLQREEQLIEKLREYASAPSSPQPLEDIRQQLHRFDNFLRFSLRKAPVVVAHQDKDLRYRFIYNAFPTLSEEEIIGKTDMEIFPGIGVAELMEFKREVLRKGFPAKREIFFNCDLFGEKTFLVAVEPVLNRSGDAMGLNYVAMDVTEQVDKRERLMRIREQVAVQKAMETELHKTIHITEETMRAKQMLATMSHEIRSPLSGVVSMAEVLATTQLDAEQRQLVDVMVSSGDLVMQLINDILDLSKVQSGAMKFEEKKFRPREVVKHVLQMAQASMQNKNLTLNAQVYDDVPLEVIGDVLRIRQVFTNLVSNAIKFTHDGAVSIIIRVVKPKTGGVDPEVAYPLASKILTSSTDSAASTATETSYCKTETSYVDLFTKEDYGTSQSFSSGCDNDSPKLMTQQSAPAGFLANREEGIQDTIWLHCDVRDTGIGIPEAALPMLFERYTQVSTTHARKYGGTGLGLAICKNLVELMGGSLTVASKENQGSTFSFELPLGSARERSLSTGQLSEEVYDMMTKEARGDGTMEILATTRKGGYIHYTCKMTQKSSSQTLTRLNAQSSRTIQANSLTSPLDASSGNAKRRPQSRNEEGNSANLQDRSAIEVTQENSPEFMDVDSIVSQTMGYKSSISRLQSWALGHNPLKSFQEESSTMTRPKSRMVRGSGSSKKLGEVQRMSSTISTPPNAIPSGVTQILLAEDNKVNVMVAQSMLKRLGHKLEVVSNGAEAIKALQRKTYDLILMDVCMPVMDGLEATRRIRRYEQTGSWEYAEKGEVTKSRESSSSDVSSDLPFGNTSPYRSPLRRRTPIIAMTANALADNMLECYSHGMDSFIAKPVTFIKLEQVLKQFIPCLDRKGSSSSHISQEEKR